MMEKYNTSNLIQRLRNKHPEEFKEYEKAQEEKTAERKATN